ncbi:hypothetical protein KI387_016120, partial [Taxus chinensis]
RPTLKAVDKSMVDIVGAIDVKGTTNVIGATDINDVGSSSENTGGKVEEGKAKLVVVNEKVGASVGGMDMYLIYKLP